MKKIVAAMAFAAEKHRHQRRKDVAASPYISHPLALANLLANEAGIVDERVLIAAVLHDALEDTETTEQELVREFGREIADIVREVTEDKARARERRTESQAAEAPQSRRARLVTLADRICSLREIAGSAPKTWPIAQQQRYFDWTKSVVEGLKGVNPALEHLFDEAYKLRPSVPDGGNAGE